MIYVGSGLRASTGRSEPALIDPTLPVHRRTTNQELPYWPSYSTITPPQRGRYLAWLASGRQDASIPIGYVFLFFYGLERRIFVDLNQAPAASLSTELPTIRAELQRLLSIHGSLNGSFQQYASRLVNVIDVLLAGHQGTVASTPPPLSDSRWFVPFELRAGLGRFAASGEPVPADWALAWGWFCPEEVKLRTPALRCSDEFASLFRIRYAEKYGDGLVVRPGKSKLRQTYHAASVGIGSVEIAAGSIPDVFEQKAPGRKLAALFESVTGELDAYSRWLGRNPGKAGSLASFALLPPVLVDGASGEVRKLREWAEQLLDQRTPVQMSGEEVLELWSSPASEKLSKADAVSFAQILEHLGVGIEPDVRFGGSPVATAKPVVLFRNVPEAPHTATPAYGAAMTLVHLAAAVGAADGRISTQEVRQLGAHVGSWLRLTPAEQTRLYAHLMWLSGTEARLTGLRKRLDGLSPSQRRSMGDVLITVAASDSVVSPEEVTTLQKIFKLLGLDQTTVTSRLHATLTSHRPPPAEQPVTVRPAGAQEPGYPIPRRQEEPPDAHVFRLDDAAIDRIQGETAAVSSLLGDLFEEDQPDGTHDANPADVPSMGAMLNDRTDQGAMSTSDAVTGQAIGSLDFAHSRLLRDLAGRDRWEWAEFEALAARYHVMPGGAIDTINEAALDAVDEPVLEGDEILTINTYAMQELLA